MGHSLKDEEWGFIPKNVKPEDFGDYNTAPKDFRAIPESEAARSLLAHYTPIYVETRQIHRHLDGSPCLIQNPFGSGMQIIPVTLFWFHDGTAIGMTCHHYGGTDKAGCMLWWRAGCSHSYRELSQSECRERGLPHHGRCFHTRECRNCGNIDSYDSSD